MSKKPSLVRTSILGTLLGLCLAAFSSCANEPSDVRNFYKKIFNDEFPDGALYVKSQYNQSGFGRSEWISIDFILNENQFKKFTEKPMTGLGAWRILQPNESYGWNGGDGNMFTIEGTKEGDILVSELVSPNSLVKIFAFRKDSRILATRFNH